MSALDAAARELDHLLELRLRSPDDDGIELNDEDNDFQQERDAQRDVHQRQEDNALYYVNLHLLRRNTKLLQSVLTGTYDGEPQPLTGWMAVVSNYDWWYTYVVPAL